MKLLQIYSLISHHIKTTEGATSMQGRLKGQPSPSSPPRLLPVPPSLSALCDVTKGNDAKQQLGEQRKAASSWTAGATPLGELG